MNRTRNVDDGWGATTTTTITTATKGSFIEEPSGCHCSFKGKPCPIRGKVIKVLAPKYRNKKD